MSEAVANLLTANDIPFTVSGKDFLIKCLNPEHDDNNPSCRVDRLSGLTHCFSCGWKRNIFKHFGVFTNNSSVRVAKLKEKLKDLRESLIEVDMPDGSIPFNQVFRGISTTTLKHFGAFHNNRDEKLQDRIIFPIKDVTGKTAAFIGRHVLSDAKPRYLVFPSGRPLPLYPSKLDNKFKSIVLVEGIFDMLNLHDKGVHNAVCTFGTSTISEENADVRFLAYKAQGIEKVYIMYDGDTAGREAAKKLEPIIQGQGFKVEIIAMEDDTDPGELNQEHVEMIREYINT
jgi:DNA primase